MIINCTKRLQDEIKIKPEKIEVISPLFSWHANIIRVNRKKTIVLVNDATSYAIIIHNLIAKDYKDIKSLITKSIKTTLVSDCVKPEIADKYIKDAGDIVFSKTQNRSLVSRMNRVCEAADVFDTEYIDNLKIQDGISKMANKWIFIHNGKETSHPNEEFYKLLEDKYNTPVFRTKALVLKIKLDLKNFDIWRRVVVPLNINFYDFHKIIRTSFDWGYQHMHETVILKQNKPLSRIASDDYVFSSLTDDEDWLFEKSVMINEYLPRYKNIKYIYDFGDYWVHDIIIENVLFDFDKNCPVCLEGNGDRPPEDVGGESGYEEFIKILDNPNHEEYHSMKKWFESQHYSGYDIDLINRRLKHLY